MRIVWDELFSPEQNTENCCCVTAKKEPPVNGFGPLSFLKNSISGLVRKYVFGAETGFCKAGF